MALGEGRGSEVGRGETPLGHTSSKELGQRDVGTHFIMETILKYVHRLGYTIVLKAFVSV